MSKRLTAKTIEALKPGTVRREVPDGTLPGLYLAVQPSGSMSYVLRYRFAGKPRKLTIGPADIGLGEARKLAAIARAAIAGGKDPAGDKKARQTALRAIETDRVETVVADFITRYVQRTNRPRTAANYKRLLAKEIVAHWHGRRLSAITRQDINRRLDEIVDRGAPVTANRTLALLRTMCRWAVSRDIIPHSPTDGITAPASETPRDRILDDQELASVWRAAEGLGWPFMPVTRLLMLTGQRRGEVAGMTWSEIDFAAATWTIPAARAKNKRQHVVPLAPEVVEILTSLPRIAGTDLVFPMPGSVSRSKRRLDAAIATETGSIPPWTLHDLRRSAASGMARLGVDLHVIERCLNHISGSFGGIVGVYQKHRYETEMRRALEMWAAHIQRIVTGESATNVVSLRGSA